MKHTTKNVTSSIFMLNKTYVIVLIDQSLNLLTLL